MSKTAQKTRRRYSPEVRRTMILDETAKLVSREGIAKLSMERIGQEMGVSKALIYNYFTNTTELLQDLLERELSGLRRLQFEAAEKATTFEELIRNVTHEYLTYIDKRGMIIDRLMSEPSLSKTTDPTEYGRDNSVDYLAKIAIAHFDLPEDLARAATDISFGIPAAAGSYLLRSDINRQDLEDLTVSMIIGTFTNVKRDYLMRKQKLKR